MIKEQFQVRPIPPEQTHEWIKRKHYAKRIPAISHSFGLYDSDLFLQGICTYGPPPRMYNNGYGIFGGELEIPTFELNRLVVNDDLPKNTLSFFVAGTFKFMPHPCCLVSYADPNHGHHGYIYQATNWLFTGTGGYTYAFKDKEGKDIHKRTLNGMFGKVSKNNIPEGYDIYETEGKYRFFQLIGNKADIKKMKKFLTYEKQPYPKGDNQNYDASFSPDVQTSLF
jgi:hypothetical protein